MTNTDILNAVSELLHNNPGCTVDDIIIELTRIDINNLIDGRTGPGYVALTGYMTYDGHVKNIVNDASCSRVILKKQKQFEDDMDDIINGI